MATQKKTDASPVNFENALQELEALVGQLEKGDLSLEDSLGAYERGIGLFRDCQSALDQAQSRLKKLAAKDAESVPEPDED